MLSLISTPVMTSFRRNRLILLAMAAIIFCTSCVNTKKAVYFNSIQDTDLIVVTQELEPIIKPSDILSITVSSLNPDATELFNKPNISTTTAAMNTPTTTQSSGFLVDLDGHIQYPIIGKIRVSGLTQKQLKAQMTKTFIDKKLLVEPVVDIRFPNFRISVMGEVARPSVVTVPSEKISLLEALALAGDLTIYARRDNVVLIREENGKRMVRRMDLNSNSILTSPYYYLKSNDVIYVEPNRSKVANSGRLTQWLPVIFSLVSLTIIVIDRYE